MTITRFQEQLKQQLTFIANSCDAYDHGNYTEAIRIGTSLRVLLHNTQNSTSLLTHLGMEQVPILSTCKIRESIPDGLAFEGLANLYRADVQPKLGQSSTLIELPADDWWQQLDIGLGNGSSLSRKNIALTAANKDGGTHVDAELPPDYKKLVDGVWRSSTRDGLLINHHFLYLRQMGYEILNSPKLLAIADYKSQTDPLKEAAPASEGMYFENFEAGSISPEEKRKIFEDLARTAPILVPSDESRYSSPCPFCRKQTPKDSSPNPPPIVEGELPLTDEEKWIYCQSDTSHLLLIQRVTIETIYPIKGQNAYYKILYKLSGNSLAKKLAKEVFNFYGEFLTYSESRETLACTYAFDIQFKPSIILTAAKIILKLDTDGESAALAHGLLYLQLPIRGFPIIEEPEIPDEMTEESTKFFMGIYSKILNLVSHEINFANFKELGYLKRHFLTGVTPPPFDYKAKVLNTNTQNYDWQIGFSFWCLEYFRHWITSRHGQSLEVQKYVNDSLKWGSELHPTLKQAADGMMEWVMIGEFKKPSQYIQQVNNLLEIMKIPKVTKWVVLENSTPQQPIPKRIIYKNGKVFC